MFRFTETFLIGHSLGFWCQNLNISCPDIKLNEDYQEYDEELFETLKKTDTELEEEIRVMNANPFLQYVSLDALHETEEDETDDFYGTVYF